MAAYLAIICCTIILAHHYAHSTSGFLVTLLGLLLLLDRLIRPRPWWKREAGIAICSFVIGAVAFYFARPGIVPLWEAAYRGVVVAVVGVGIQVLAHVTRARWTVRFVAFLGFVLLIPILGGLHPLHTVPKRAPVGVEEVRFRTSDGLELGGWLVRHPHPRGNVIFCHGHGRNRGHVAALLTTFHDVGLNVLAFDFRGHGESEGHTSTFGFREVHDLLAAEAYMKRRCPDQPLLLVGVSLGAAVSLQALPQMPNVKGVWSEGAFACLGNAVDYKFSALPAALRVPLVRFYYILGWLDCGMWGASVSPVERLQGLNAPIFFCHAMKDELVPFSEGLTLFKAYAGPKDHWWVEGASHYNIRQRNHDEYPRRLREFIERCLRRSDRN